MRLELQGSCIDITPAAYRDELTESARAASIRPAAVHAGENFCLLHSHGDVTGRSPHDIWRTGSHFPISWSGALELLPLVDPLLTAGTVAAGKCYQTV